MITEEIIEELVDIILMQEKEIKALQEKIRRIEDYIEVYEKYIKGE